MKIFYGHFVKLFQVNWKKDFFFFSIFETNKDRLLRNDLNYIWTTIEILIEFNFNYRINI